MKSTSLIREIYSWHISEMEKNIEYCKKMGIEYSKILSSGKYNGKPLKKERKSFYKQYLIEFKRSIQQGKKIIDDLYWDLAHIICEKDVKCGQYNPVVPSCGHDTIVVIKSRQGYHHWGKEVCPKCGVHQKWVSYQEGEYYDTN